MSDLDLTAFYGQFRDEAWENLDLLEQDLAALEAQPDDTALLDRMLRAIHTTKGSAKIMGFAEINRLGHEIEEVLGAVRKGQTALTPEVGNAILQASGGIRALTTALVEGRQPQDVDTDGLLAALRQVLGAQEARPPQAEAAPLVTMAAAPAGRPRETIRVDLERLDQLAQLVGETMALQQRAIEERDSLHELLRSQEEAERALSGLRDRLEAYRERFRPLQAEEVFHRLDGLENTIQQLVEQGRTFNRDHSALIERFTLALDELHREALIMRMVPIGTLFEVFPGVVRRLAAECGVEVNLEVQGADVELDRRVLDLLRDPLIHLVRNALDHGVEPPAERKRLGKPPRGQIVLEADQKGQRVQVRVQDDGRGIDLEQVRRTAVERGVLSEKQASEADDKLLMDVIFRPGFSTRQKATDMSGRGVGLDVVQTTMRQLNGLVQVLTQLGKGTTFLLDVPLTLATMRVLMVECGGETMAVPASAIRNLVRIGPEQIVSVEGHPMLHWQEHTVPVLPLASVLGLPARERNKRAAPALVLGTDGRQVALTVDQLLDEVEVVVRPLGEILGRSAFFSAATISGTGDVIPILDLAGLLHAGPLVTQAEQPQLELATAPRPRATASVLLVEDAITTRELERSILEAAGYRVETAYDGMDALEKLERGDFRIVITDIEMPRMDGFELTTRLRQEPRWAGLPVVIITAREDEEGRRRGLQAGAQAYIVKSRFDQSNLLETIAHLAG